MEHENRLTLKDETHINPGEEIRIFDLHLDERLIIMWGWLWRSIVVTIIVMIIAGLIGSIIGFISGIVAVSQDIDIQEYELIIQLIGGVIGFLVGFASLAYFIDWIAKSRFGKYRFVLIRKP